MNMICELYTLMNKYRNKKLYIWNINRNSTIVFTKAIFSKIDIRGFVVTKGGGIYKWNIYESSSDNIATSYAGR